MTDFAFLHGETHQAMNTRPQGLAEILLAEAHSA